jgi:hypothetical protein
MKKKNKAFAYLAKAFIKDTTIPAVNSQKPHTIVAFRQL